VSPADSPDELAWNFAYTLHTREAIQRFISNFSQSPRRRDAEALLANLEHATTVKSDSTQRVNPGSRPQHLRPTVVARRHYQGASKTGPRIANIDSVRSTQQHPTRLRSLQLHHRAIEVDQTSTLMHQPLSPPIVSRPDIAARASGNSGGNGGGGGGGSGGGSGGGGGGGWSDRRLKRRIQRVGISPSGLGIYSFQYVWGGPVFVGVIAQEILEVRPEAVVQNASGYLMVDYSLIDVAMMQLDDWVASMSEKEDQHT
jgi:hypothetical protein